MERRRDNRHGLSYRVSLRCHRTRRVLPDAATEDVSASGARIRSDEPHGFGPGDSLEMQLYARVRVSDGEDTLVLATDAVVVRAKPQEVGLRFRAPLTY